MIRAIPLLLLLAVAGCRRYWNEDMSDPAVKARVLHELKADPSLDLSRVVIDVHVGTVTLSGIVRTEEERDRLRRVARRVRGAEQVDVNVVVVP